MRAQAEEGLQVVIDREQRMEEQARKKKEEQAKKVIKKRLNPTPLNGQVFRL